MLEHYLLLCVYVVVFALVCATHNDQHRLLCSLGIHPALIAGIISRQSEAGTKLTREGYGQSDPSCYGLMQVCVSSIYWSLFKLCGQCCDCVFSPMVQINRHYHAVKGGPFSLEHLDQGATFLIQLIKTMKRAQPNWTKEQQLKGKNAPP